MKTINLKNLVIIFVSQLLLITSVQARCNLELFRFGSSVEDLHDRYSGLESTIDMPGMPRLAVRATGDSICPYDKNFSKASVRYIFLYGKLVEVNISSFANKPVLIDWVESAYGNSINKQSDIYRSNPNVQLVWDKPDIVILYNLRSNGVEKIEQVFIQSRNHKNIHQKFSKEIEGK